MEKPEVSIEEIALLHKNSIVDISDGKGGSQPLAIVTIGNAEIDQRVNNVKRNIKRDVIRFMRLPGLMLQRNEPIAIVGGGPSLASQFDAIRKFKQVMVAGSPHDYLVCNGIVPSFALAADVQEETIDYYKYPQLKTSYLIASVCPPALFDHLANHKVAMWHFKGQVEDEVYQGEQAINWGCMASIHCIQMALLLGFQHLHFFGLDCCNRPSGTHAYAVGEREEKDTQAMTLDVEVGAAKTPFRTTTALLAQAQHFFQLFESEDGQYLKGYVYGDGLLAEVIRQSPPEMREWLEAA